jgi:hypothetical protein
MYNKMKECSKCKVAKENIEFGISSRAKDGFNSWCKPCVRERSKQWYKINFETEQDPDIYYSCFESSKCYLEKYPTSSVVFQNDFFFQNNFTIPEGNYSINTLINVMNDFITSGGYNNVKVNYITYNNKFTITSTQSPYLYSALNKIDTQYNLEFIFSNKLKKMLGITDNPNIARATNITAPNFINLLSFKKILIVLFTLSVFLRYCNYKH